MSPNKSKHPRDEFAIDIMVKEVLHLNEQIHQYLRLTEKTMALAISIVAAVVAAQKFDAIRLPAVVSAPLVLCIIFVFHANNDIESIVQSEVRDRLSRKINRLVGDEVILIRDASDELRFSCTTRILAVLYGILMLVVICLAFYLAFKEGNANLWVITILSSGLSVALTCLAYHQVPKMRAKITDSLNEKYGTIDCPPNASDNKSSLIEKLTKKKL